MVDATFLIETAIGVAILAAIALIGSNFSTIVSFFSGEWTRTIERARQQKAAREQLYGYATVNHSQVDRSIMSRENGQTPQTGRTDGQTDRVSEADQWLAKIEVDKTKTALIELLVYSGWDVSQIRTVVKGDNGVLGNEVEAARQRLGIEAPAAPAQYVTPIVGRATSAQFETDRDFPYQAPAH
jgi:hypothetical protein